MKKNKKQIINNFIDTESASIAAGRGLSFEESKLEDTPKNREFYRILQAETQKMLRGGIDVNIQA